jgi:hypothetical protein
MGLVYDFEHILDALFHILQRQPNANFCGAQGDCVIRVLLFSRVAVQRVGMDRELWPLLQRWCAFFSMTS